MFCERCWNDDLFVSRMRRGFWVIVERNFHVQNDRSEHQKYAPLRIIKGTGLFTFTLKGLCNSFFSIFQILFCSFESRSQTLWLGEANKTTNLVGGKTRNTKYLTLLHETKWKMTTSSGGWEHNLAQWQFCLEQGNTTCRSLTRSSGHESSSPLPPPPLF